MTTDFNTNLASLEENFMNLDGESSIFKQNLNTQSENYINLGMLINSLEKDPQAFWGSIDSFFYKTITPSDKNGIDTLIAQLSVSSPDDAISEAKEKLRIEDIVNPEYLASMSNGQKSIQKKQTLLNEIDLLTAELEKTTKDQRILHIENVQQLLELKDRILRDEDQNESLFESKYSPLVYKIPNNNAMSNHNGQNLSQQTFSKASIQFQADFIKKLILELEDYQTAESIKYVIDCRKDENSHEFCIIFDKSISDTETWIKEDLLDKFDKFREQSLFKIHAVPQKVSQSLTTFNITALFSCNQKQIHRRLDIKERPWKEVIIKSLGENPSLQSNIFYKEKMQTKANQLELCHHCRYLFPKEFTFGCHYQSSKMGLNLSAADDLLKDMEKNQSANFMYNWNEEKDEYVCGRRYCASCLRSNYDVNIHHMKTERNWLCPFCKGTCFCSRCLRNDQINKLIQLYTDIGGSPKAITSESSLRNILWKTVKKTPAKLSEDIIITLPRPISPSKKKKNSRKKNSKSEPNLHKKIKITPEKEKLLQRKKESESNKTLSRSSRSKNKELSHCQEEPLLSYRKSLYKIPKSNLEIPSLPPLKFQSLKIDSNEELNKLRFQFEQ